MATGGVWDLFVLLPKILDCWGFFARAFLLGRLVFFNAPGLPDKPKIIRERVREEKNEIE